MAGFQETGALRIVWFVRSSIVETSITLRRATRLTAEPEPHFPGTTIGVHYDEPGAATPCSIFVP